MREIRTNQAPAAIGPYSQGIQVEPKRMFFFSGQLGIDPQTGSLVAGGIEAEVRQALTNVKNLLSSEAMNFDNVVKVTVFLSGMEHFESMNNIYSTHFLNFRPARSCVAVKGLPKSALVEIEVVAVKE
ncbi:MAG: Rid family detoxifying hydrolase [Candidatus Eisenbacteria bacterium]|nr:Rid family detoxifying hydrolase [Candidatus Eisenbacteria bacterium]